MRRIVGVAFFAALAISTMAAQAVTPAPAAAPTAGKARHHGAFTVELLKTLDSRKVKPRDMVETKLTGGITLPDGTVVPRGALVIGHVTEATARSTHDSESALGISFDKIALSGGEMLITGVAVAAAPNPEPTESPDAAANIYVSLDKGTTASIGHSQTSRSTPLLNDESRGVLGIDGLHLRSDGIFTSDSKQVKLNSGMRLLLNVTLQ